MTARRFLATLHYDGTGFAGWQRQPVERTVQGEIEAALGRLLGSRVAVRAAGRTDTGVHAVGQAADFVAPERWTGDALQRALNAVLPSDVWVADVRWVVPGFDARRSALSRCYRYVIGTDKSARSPFRHPFEWALCRALDLDVLRSVSTAVVGQHDFRALAAVGHDGHYRCRVLSAEWAARGAGKGVAFTIEADRFMHRMVRFLVGTMVDIGLGRRPPADLATLLHSTDNRKASRPAPPQGLYLVAVHYPTDLFAEASR